MDGLISLLIIFGLLSMLSSNKKKAQKRQAQRAKAFREAAESIPTREAPISMEKWKELLQEKSASNASVPPVVRKIAEERAKFILGRDGKTPVAQTVQPAKPAYKPKLEDDAPEGSISTQGESAAEHAEHRRKVLAEEANFREEQAIRQEMRSLNLKKLRNAVVMSEILDKPVSLRSRRI